MGKQIPLEQAAWLDRQFEEEGIKMTVFSLEVDKAGGPDGFTMAFFQEYLGYYKGRFDQSFLRIPHAWEGFQGFNLKLINLIPK